MIRTGSSRRKSLLFKLLNVCLLFTILRAVRVPSINTASNDLNGLNAFEFSHCAG